MNAAQAARPVAPTQESHTSNVPAVDVEALAGAVARELAAAPPPDALLDADGAAALLNVPASWVLAEARAERIPHVRLGRYVRFDRDELRTWTTGRQRGPRQRTGSNPVTRSAGDR